MGMCGMCAVEIWGWGIGTMLRIIVHFAHKIYYRCAFVLHRRIE